MGVTVPHDASFPGLDFLVGALFLFIFNRNSLQKPNVRCDFSDVAYFTAVLYRFLKDLCLFFCNDVL